MHRASNPDIQKWMAAHNYTSYAKLEEYYEQKWRQMLHLFDDVGIILFLAW